MSDVELTSQNYFVGPKTEDRICSHTTAIFEMLDGVIKEVYQMNLVPKNELKQFYTYCNRDYILILNFVLVFSSNIMKQMQKR